MLFHMTFYWYLELPSEAILGKGMFGTVWRAMDSRSGHWYAVKKSHTYRQATVTREREVTNHVGSPRDVHIHVYIYIVFSI